MIPEEDPIASLESLIHNLQKEHLKREASLSVQPNRSLAFKATLLNDGLTLLKGMTDEDLDRYQRKPTHAFWLRSMEDLPSIAECYRSGCAAGCSGPAMNFLRRETKSQWRSVRPQTACNLDVDSLISHLTGNMSKARPSLFATFRIHQKACGSDSENPFRTGMNWWGANGWEVVRDVRVKEMRKGPIDTILACFENFKAAEDQDQSHTGTVHHMFGLLHDQYALQTQGNIDAIASFRRPSSEQGRSYKLLHSLHLSEQEAVHMKRYFVSIVNGTYSVDVNTDTAFDYPQQDGGAIVGSVLDKVSAYQMAFRQATNLTEMMQEATSERLTEKLQSLADENKMLSAIITSLQSAGAEVH